MMISYFLSPQTSSPYSPSLHPLSQITFLLQPEKARTITKTLPETPTSISHPVLMFFLPINIDDVSVILCIKSRFLLCNVIKSSFLLHFSLSYSPYPLYQQLSVSLQIKM